MEVKIRPAIVLILIFLIGLVQPLAAQEKEEEPSAEEAPQISYYRLQPSIVVNVMGKAQYMRCDVQLMTRNTTLLSELATHAPALRHELLLLFSDQKGNQIKTASGKERLRKKALKALQGVMTEMTGQAVVDDLFFTSFFVQ